MEEDDPYSYVQDVTKTFHDWAHMHRVPPSIVHKLQANGVNTLDDVLHLDGDSMAAFSVVLEPDEWFIFRDAILKARSVGVNMPSSEYMYLDPLRPHTSADPQQLYRHTSSAQRPPQLPPDPRQLYRQTSYGQQPQQLPPDRRCSNPEPAAFLHHQGRYQRAQLHAQKENPYNDDDLYEDVPCGDGPDLQETIHNAKRLSSNPGQLIQYKVEVTETARAGGVKVRKCEFGSRSGTATEKYIMLLGETGAGKSTLIDAMLNYILGVSYEDNFRLRLIDPMGEDPTWRRHNTDSQTDWITCYTVHQQFGGRLGYTLHIVDTPGFGDTRGIDHDKTIVDQIRELFGSTDTHGITWIDALCIVVKSSTNRLAAKEKYVLDSVLALFGKDVEDSICAMVTFSDQQSIAMQALKEAQVPVTKSYEFNNNWFSSNSSAMSKLFWEMTRTSLEEFFKMLETTTSVSLRLAAEVLEERKLLEKHAEGLIELIRKVSGELSVLRNTRAVIEQGNDDDKKVNVIEMKTRKVATKQKNRSCTTCLVTCQKSCDTLQRFKYAVKTAKAICEVCKHPNKDHVVHKWKYEAVQIDTVKTVRELKLEQGQGGMTSDEEVKAFLQQKEEEGLGDMRRHLGTMRTCMMRLDEIALRPRTASMQEYVDLVMDRELAEKKPGHLKRIEMLQKLTQIHSAMQNVDEEPDVILDRFNRRGAFSFDGSTASDSII